jgi:predicted acyltransferase
MLLGFVLCAVCVCVCVCVVCVCHQAESTKELNRKDGAIWCHPTVADSLYPARFFLFVQPSAFNFSLSEKAFNKPSSWIANSSGTSTPS